MTTIIVPIIIIAKPIKYVHDNFSLKIINDRKVPILETKYYELEGIEDYISPDYKPNSLKGAEYYVSDDDGKITIAIAKEAADVGELYINDIYDGTGAGWVYIEGQY